MDMLQEFLSRRGVSAGTLAYSGKAAAGAESARTADFVMTAETVDRHGDIVVTAGIDTTNFEQNPVLLLNHNWWGLPIGKWAGLTRHAKRLDGTAHFVGDLSDEAEAVWRLVDGGALRACSIGFYPKLVEGIYDADRSLTGFRILESELLECSVVTIPANTHALKKAYGLIGEKAVKSLAEMAMDLRKGPSPAAFAPDEADLEAIWREISGPSVPVEAAAPSAVSKNRIRAALARAKALLLRAELDLS